MLTTSAGRDPHQPGHLAPVAAPACSIDTLLDYSVLPGAQAAKDAHAHLCPSSQFLLQQSISAVEKGWATGV